MSGTVSATTDNATSRAPPVRASRSGAARDAGPELYENAGPEPYQSAGPAPYGERRSELAASPAGHLEPALPRIPLFPVTVRTV
ncbi:hypothetical protein ACWD4G_17720 [Streptomyces sp. NPDC002643]